MHYIGCFRSLKHSRTVEDPEIGTVQIPCGTQVKVTEYATMHGDALIVTTYQPGMRHYSFRVKPNEIW